MARKYELVFKYIFPKFSVPNKSRFLGISFTNNVNNEINTNIPMNSFEISLEKIKNSEDKRTSIILKNIPNTLNKENLNKLLLGVGNINYLYLPFDKISKKNFGFAFVNMVNYKSIIQLYNKLTSLNFDNSNNTIEIYYSKIQGKEGLSKMFRNNKFIK
jgi:RNA recognition motif-containing protein